MSNSVYGLPRPDPALSAPNQRPAETGENGFANLLRGAIGETESLQKDAQQQVAAVLNGTGQDVHSAMIAVEKADLSFQLMMQVRNKIVEAYQEISHLNF